MGRRRRRSEDEGVIDALIDIAIAWPVAGLVIAAVLGVAGSVLVWLVRDSMMGLGRLFGIAFLFLSAVFLLCAIGGGIAGRLKQHASERSGNTSGRRTSSRRTRREGRRGGSRKKPAWWKGYEEARMQAGAATKPPGGTTLVGTKLQSGQAARERAKMPYKRCARLLSRGEHAFWHPLYYAVKGKYRIFPKVRLADVVQGPAKDDMDRYWFDRIGAFHIDFVLCDPDTTEPLMAIELDDRSHQTPRSLRRDAFKDRVLGDAGIPVLRIPSAEAYEPVAIAEQVARFVGKPVSEVRLGR